MRTKREVLSIDSGLGAGHGRFGSMHDYCRELNLHVTSTSDTSWIFKLLESSDPVAAILVDGNVISPEESITLLDAVRSTGHDIPICWQRSTAPESAHFRPDLPDRSLEFEGNPESDREILIRALKKCFFPRIVAYAMEFSTRLALNQSYHLNIERQESYLRNDHTPLGEVSSVIRFFGGSTMGSVVVSASKAVLRDTYHKVLPNSNGNASNIEEMMVGDMCNAIVGRFKGCMEQNGTHLKMTWPMTATGYPMGLSVSTGRPALVQKLFTHDELYVELYLDQIQEKAVKYNYTSRQVNFGELNFL